MSNITVVLISLFFNTRAHIVFFKFKFIVILLSEQIFKIEITDLYIMQHYVYCKIILFQLDELINRTEKEYTTAELPSDLNQAERMLEEHKIKKSEVNQLLTFTADEGEKIVVRVRQQVS